MLNLFIVCVVSLAMTGCALSPKMGPQIDPIFIHKADESSSPNQTSSTLSSTIKTAVEAEQVPIVEYYAALSAARASPTNTATIANYIDSGITLVNSYCLRWFQQLSEQDIKKSFADSNINVIRALGTALLGLGKANTFFVTGYGASNTAYEGLSKNYGDAFLLAPNSRKVKAQILSLLDARSSELTGADKPKTFAEAYRKLERFADLCTHATAKEVVNNALDQAKATADAAGKKATEDAAAKFSQDNTKLIDQMKDLQAQLLSMRNDQTAANSQITKLQCSLIQAKKSPPESDDICK